MSPKTLERFVCSQMAQLCDILLRSGTLAGAERTQEGPGARSGSEHAGAGASWRDGGATLLAQGPWVFPAPW
jgi:hypothetical protein